jgi:hypothetical protein
LIVECNALKLSIAQLTSLSIVPSRNQYSVTLRRKYLVLGLTFVKNTSLVGNEGAVAITDNNSYVVHAPLAIFDILDNRVSSNWRFGKNQLGDICLWPPSFFRDYYLDDLIEGVPEVVDDFRRVYEDLRIESGFSDRL